jgi:hypothetical protein
MQSCTSRVHVQHSCLWGKTPALHRTHTEAGLLICFHTTSRMWSISTTCFPDTQAARHRQEAKDQFDPECPDRISSCGRKCPRLVEKKMGQKKNRLNRCNETDYTFSYPHHELDSSTHDSHYWHKGRKVIAVDAPRDGCLPASVPGNSGYISHREGRP